jgi:hypothetical protein
MGWNTRAATIELTILAICCAGCAGSGGESQGPGRSARPTTAISATTWKESPRKGKAASAAAATRTSSAAPAEPVRHKVQESAEQLLTSAVAADVAQDDDHVAIAVDDLSNGQFAAYNGNDQDFDTASIVKVDILATLLYQSQQQSSQMTSYEQSLATTMIENSNNDSASALYDDDGESAGIDAANKSFGLTETAVGTDGYWGLTTTTTDDQIQLLRQVFTSQTVLTPASQDYIRGLMSQVESDQQWGVPSAADSGTAFYVKNGWLPNPDLWEINSIGEVTHDGQRMLIAALSSDNETEDGGISLIEGIIGKAASAVAAYGKA